MSSPKRPNPASRRNSSSGGRSGDPTKPGKQGESAKRAPMRPVTRAILVSVFALPVLAAFLLSAFIPDDIGTPARIGVDAQVTALLPTGANTVRFVQTIGSERAELNGYVDFSDCSTDVTGSVTTEKGDTGYEYRNDGNGEAVRSTGGLWYDIADPDGPLLAVYSPTHVGMFSVEQERGIICAVGLLDELATIDPSLPSTSVTTLAWDAARSEQFHSEQAAIVGEKIFRAYGASDAEIEATAELIQQLFAPDFTTFRASSGVTVERIGDETVIVITAEGDAGAELRSEFRFTPTQRRDVLPVRFERYLAKLTAEAKASGKTFKQLLTEQG